MEKNVGRPDKTFRLIVAAIIGLLYYFNVITEILDIVLLIVAIVLVGVSLIGFCPLYLPFGINTCRRKTKK